MITIIKLIKQKQHIIKMTLDMFTSPSPGHAQWPLQGSLLLAVAGFFFGFSLMDGHLIYWEIEALSHMFIHLQGLLLVLEVCSDLSDLF